MSDPIFPHGTEIKAGGHGDIFETLDELVTSFEAFKESNDDRLRQIEQTGRPDVITEEKLARIDAALDDQTRRLNNLTLKAARPQLAPTSKEPGGVETAAKGEHKQAFHSYIRQGEQMGLRKLEVKALSISSDPDGGYLVPDETEQTVMRSLADASPIRAIAAKRQVSAAIYKKPFSITGPGTGWVGETAARPETTTPTLAELSFPTMELYAMPAATPALLEDSVVNIDQWIAEEVRQAFAEQEDAAFVNGDGTNKPRGFLDYPKVAQTSWSWGNLGYVATGVSGDFAATNPSDQLIDLIYSLRSGYRKSAHWVMSRSTQAAIRKIKDADGNYIWQPGAGAGEAPTLLGFPIAETENAPAIAADSLSIAFGDFSRGYLIVDRVGIRVLRDPYSSKPYVLFYTTKRVGGGVQDFDAIKLLKFGIS